MIIGLPHLDALVDLRDPSIDDYCKAAAEYVTHATRLGREYVDDLNAYRAELDAAHVEEVTEEHPDEESDSPKAGKSKKSKRPPSKGKVAQIRLSAALGRSLLHDLRARIDVIIRTVRGGKRS